MSKIYEAILEVLEEQNLSIRDIENSKIFGDKTIYNFSQENPSLKSLMKLANYLKVSIDYLLGFSDKNSFKEYDIENINFNKNLREIIHNEKISMKQMARDLKMGETNFVRWNRGVYPRLDKLVDIANYLKCSIDDLLL